MLLAVRVRSNMNPRFWPYSRGRAGERNISHALQFRMPWTGQFVALTHRNQETGHRGKDPQKRFQSQKRYFHLVSVL